MNTIVTQIHRSGEWRKLSSVEFDPGRERQLRRGDITEFNRAGAIREGIRHLSAWSEYFSGEQLRVVEVAGYRRELVEVIAGRKG